MIQIDRKVILRELRDIFLLILVGFAMTLVFGYTKSASQFWLVGFFGACMWISLWKGNSYLSEILSLRNGWLTFPVRTFFIGIASTLIYTVGIVFLLVKLFELVYSVNFGDISRMLYSSVVVTIIITFFMHGRSFLLSWKETAIDAEKLKRESVSARYESLKNQVNPHFLFNSLNALTNLVYEDQNKAVKFIKQLADVYRYVLDTREMEIVALADEIKFLESYAFLQQIRFGEKLSIKILTQDSRGGVAPLALQMLIENAVKHNEISEQNPLSIKVYYENNYIVVENNLQKKVQTGESSSGLGLENIIKRYQFLSDKKVEVSEKANHFIVKLPLIPQP